MITILQDTLVYHRGAFASLHPELFSDEQTFNPLGVTLLVTLYFRYVIRKVLPVIRVEQFV